MAKKLMSIIIVILTLLSIVSAQNGPGDPDIDGLKNSIEKFYGTLPGYWDSDNDGIGDGLELAAGHMNPLDTPGETNQTDSDSDQLGDQLELEIGTQPNNWDSDNDGLGDGVEYILPNRNPILYEDCAQGLNCNSLTNDHDQISNVFEQLVLKTDVNVHDTDNDGYGDEVEYVYGSDPLCKNNNLMSDGDCVVKQIVKRESVILKLIHWFLSLFN